MVLKKTKRDVGNILVLGAGLGVGTAVEAKLSPATSVFPTVAPIAVVAAPIIGAGILLRSVNKLSMVGQSKKQPKNKMRFL